MGPKRIALLACLSFAGLVGVTDAPGAQGRGPHAPGVSAHGGFARPSHPGGPRHGWGTHRHGSSSHWGWGLGLAIGLPWALGWYDPWWGPVYYPRYAYGPVYRGYGYGSECAQDEDCLRERLAQSEPAPPPPTTEVAPAAPGEEGGPVVRPLHLNYCDSAKAWFPHVRTCPGGWRIVPPAYAR